MNLKKIHKILKRKAPSELFESICDLYRDVRLSGVAECDGDMLLYQYGVYDWGEGEWFELDLTRQAMDEDDEITKVRTVLYFNVTPELRDTGEFNQWCESPQELNEFIKTIQNSKAYQICRSLKPHKLEVAYENV